MASVDIVPGLGAAKKFMTTGKVTSKVADFSKIGLKTADFAKVRQSIGNTVQTARTKGLERIGQLKEVGKSTVIAAGKKIEKDVIDLGKVIDKGATAAKQIRSDLSPQHVTPEGLIMRETAENTHAVENIFRGQMENVKGVFGSGTTSRVSDNLIKDGGHFLDEFKLKPNVKYETNGYHYQTDDLGRKERASGELTLEMGERNGKHQLAAGGEDRVKAPSTLGDHGGHLIGTQFNGSPLIDNIVAMNGNVNVSAYKRLEISWATGQQVLVDIKPVYEGKSLRPIQFEIKYKIEGKKSVEILENILEEKSKWINKKWKICIKKLGNN